MPIAALLAAQLLATDPCAGKGTTLLVQAGRHLMSFCEAAHQVKSFKVALGPGGVGKRVEGDAKVPLGTYPLAAPVASTSYHLFILVGYPTPSQRQAGFTGGAVGVHGPARCCPGASSTDNDWTLGCVAVGTDAEIEEVAAWLEHKRVKRIVIQAD